MSDYFAALMRSAGAPVPAPGPRAAPSGAEDLVEQDIEIETGVTAASAGHEHVAAQGAPSTSRTMTDGERVASAAPPPLPVASEPALPPVAAQLLQGEVHPAVRAALRWVTATQSAGDTTAVERDAPRHAGESTIAAPAPRGRADPTAVTPSTTQARPAIDEARPPEPAIVRAPLPAARVIGPAARGLTAEAARARHPAPAVRASAGRAAPDPFESLPRPPASEPVDVHIGTIHVQVDAPAVARGVAPPAPAAPASQPARAAAGPATGSGGFARARLPRF